MSSTWLKHSFETWTGPAGRPGPGTGLGLSKNLPGSWPGKTPSTWNLGDLGKPDWDPVFFFLIQRHETTSFWPFKKPKRWRRIAESQREPKWTVSTNARLPKFERNMKYKHQGFLFFFVVLNFSAVEALHISTFLKKSALENSAMKTQE